MPPLHASLVGSTARGDGTTTSDADVFLVRPGTVAVEDVRWRGQHDRLSDLILSWTGNHAGLADVPEQELERLRRDRPRVVEDLERDAVTLVGPGLRELLAPRTR